MFLRTFLRQIRLHIWLQDYYSEIFSICYIDSNLDSCDKYYFYYLRNYLHER